MSSFHVLTRAAAATALLLAPIRADVLIVDAAGSGDFQGVQPAIDAAADGDTILIRTGSYAGFLVSRRELTITAAAGATVDVQGAVRVRRLLPGQTAVVAGLDVQGLAAPKPLRPGLLAFDNEGPLRIEECSLVGADNHPVGSIELGGASGLELVSSDDVVVSGGSVAGGQQLVSGSWWGCVSCQAGAPLGWADYGVANGIRSSDSRSAVFDATALGGHGQDVSPGFADGNSGGSAAWLTDSTLFATNAMFTGGDGADSNGSLTWGGNGGHGISLDGPAGSTATLLAGLATGGAFGYGVEGLSSCVHGCSGQPVWVGQASSSMTLPVAAVTMQLASPATEGALLPISFTGSPGDDVFLFVSTTTVLGTPHPWIGELVVGLPLSRRLKLGQIGPTGQLSTSLPLPAVPDGQAINLYVQVLGVDALGSAVLGTARTIVVLDASI